MPQHKCPFIISEITDPAVLAEADVRAERFLRNYAWLQEHASEVFRHRGKIVCIAGQELFVGDTVEDVLARARAAHPDYDGRFTRIIPKERGPRIHANRWAMDDLRRRCCTACLSRRGPSRGRVLTGGSVPRRYWG